MAFPRILQRLFANSGAGPKLRHDIIPWDEESRITSLEAWRQAMIGTPMPMASTTLQPGFMWADGSFASFAVYPELKAKYDAGGFAGMLLPYTAQEGDISAYPGKFKPDAANPTGLFLPRLEGLFARYCGQEGAGEYQADAVQTGITQITSRPWSSNPIDPPVGPHDVFGSTIRNTQELPGGIAAGAVSSFSANYYFVWSVQQRTADKTRPENVALPVALYLGRPAQV